MEFIVLPTSTSLAYGCMGLCCEMLNLVVLGQILCLDLDVGFQ